MVSKVDHFFLIRNLENLGRGNLGILGRGNLGILGRGNLGILGRGNLGILGNRGRQPLLRGIASSAT